ncbi:MAG: PcfJ domain-containing protein, partial [Candidatus Izemoplasmatales bacterium]
IQTTANIFLYSFDDAYNQQDLWHKELFKKYNIEKINIPEIDNRRILYRCSNKSNFIYLLEEKDLAYEGAKMGTCVGGKNYKSKIKNNISTIISIRDKHNIPHVTIEIYNQTNTVTQIYGKGNSEISEKYKKIILEFILFATDYENMENKRLIEILNIEKTL